MAGAIFAAKLARIDVKDSRFTSNYAGESGGAVVATEKTNVTLVDTDVNNNTAGNRGGALGLWGFAHMVVHRSRVWGNTGSCQGGGAAAVFGGGALIVSHSHVWNNTGSNLAGAVSLMKRGMALITACNLSYNTAGSQGGALHVGDTAKASVEHSLLAGNQVSGLEPCTWQSGRTRTYPHARRPNGTGCGGDISLGGAWDWPVYASSMELKNTSVINNTAAYGGGLCAIAPYVAPGTKPEYGSVLLSNKTTFMGNRGTPGADVFAANKTVLSMPLLGSNLNSSMETVHWPVVCSMGHFVTNG